MVLNSLRMNLPQQMEQLLFPWQILLVLREQWRCTSMDQTHLQGLRSSFQPSGFDVVLDFGVNEIVWHWTDSQSQVDCTRFPPITKLPNREAPPITELQWKSTNHGLAREKFARIANLWIHWFWRRWHRCDCKVHSLARSLWRQGAFLNFASKE